jgi:hypothetical protein
MNSMPMLPTAIELESVVVTAQLQERPPRQVDLQRENAAFRELAGHLNSEPDAFLQRLAETTVNLCDADTVGISVEQTDENGEKDFPLGCDGRRIEAPGRWHYSPPLQPVWSVRGPESTASHGRARPFLSLLQGGAPPVCGSFVAALGRDGWPCRHALGCRS